MLYTKKIEIYIEPKNFAYRLKILRIDNEPNKQERK